MQDKTRFFITILTLIWVIWIIQGCANFQKEPSNKQYFDLSIVQPLPRINSPDIAVNGPGKPILIKELSIAPAFDSHAFIYRTGPHNFQPDFYNEFISYPARLITEEIAEGLSISGFFYLPLTHQKKRFLYRLSGKITQLYCDIQEPKSPKAVIGIRLILDERRKEEFASLSNQTYRIETDIASARPDDLVKGWNEGLTLILTKFLSDFNAAARE